jgi:hypothetical protein
LIANSTGALPASGLELSVVIVGLIRAKRQPALPDSNDLAPLLNRKNPSKRDILGT